MTQQNNQQNKQHPNQGQRPQQQANTNTPASSVSLDTGAATTGPARYFDTIPKKEDLKQLLSRLVTEVLAGKLHPEKARIELHNWYHGMSSEEQQAFKASRVQADETMQWFKGVVEILAQELPSLYVA